MDNGSKLLNMIRLRKKLSYQKMGSDGTLESVPTDYGINESLLNEELRLQELISKENKRLKSK